jgi:hypothetical protein
MKKIAITFFFYVVILSSYPQISICNNQIWASDTISNNYIDGHIYYSAETRTLTLDNAQIDVPWPNDDHITDVLFLSECQLEIHLIGENTISGIFPINLFRSNCVISGSGKLILRTLNFVHCCSVNFQDTLTTLSIQNNAEVECYAYNEWNTGAGFRGHGYDWNDTTIALSERSTEYAGNVFVNSATLRINADMCIYRLADLRLDGCHFSSPENAYFDSDLHTVVSSEQMVTEYLEVLPGSVGIPNVQLETERAWGALGSIHIENVSYGQSVKIYNITGQEIYRTKAHSSKIKLETSPGIYIVRFQNHSQKVVVY